MSIINKELTETLRDYISSQRKAIYTQPTELVAFPSAHSTEETKQACTDAAQVVTDIYAGLGTELETYHTVDGSIVLSGFVFGSPESAKTILFYFHYNVQPADDKSAWIADSWTLDERNDRWYGRGTADCKGNVVMHLAALRALRDDAFVGRVDVPNTKLIVEGSEERGSAGLGNLIATQLEFFDTDVILIADTDNAEVDQPILITTLCDTADVGVHVGALEQPVRSGILSGMAPNALAALIRMFDSPRDKNGFTSIDGLDCSQRWEGLDHAPETPCADAGTSDGMDLISDEGASVSDLIWARPSVIVTGINCPPTTNVVNAISSTAMAHVNFRIPGGIDPIEAQDALENHLHVHTPWGVKVTVERDELANPFRVNVEGKVVQLVVDSLSAVHGKETASMGEGTLVSLCATSLEAVPGADIVLYGVEELQVRTHSADESADSNETRDIVIGGAVFLAPVSGI